MADEHTESMYRAYVRERVGNWKTEPLSHAQIVADGVFGAEVEAFGLRYSLEVAAYADAMIQRNKANGWITPGPHHDRSVDGRPLNDHVPHTPDRPLQP